MKQIQLANFEIQLERKMIKHLHLKVCPPDGIIKISAPNKMSLSQISEFVAAKSKWIKHHQLQIQSRTYEASKTFTDGERHYFMGTPLVLSVIVQTRAAKITVVDNRLLMFVRKDTNLEKKKKLLDAWYRQQLRAQILVIISKYQPIMGVVVRDFALKRMKTRWGTCNYRVGRIWLNTELATKSFQQLEYVVVHEMVHLLEPSHNHRFVGFMNQFLPNWQAVKTSLNGQS